jgi:Tol biopolymer transport system component/DNA-binding winged helix-turn-helix (wHTH) protein
VPEVSTNGSAGQTRIRFGLFELDTRSRELHKSGHKIRLQFQPFQLLVMLLESPGEVVTREALRSRLWPIDTFVDFDHGLNAAIKRLRDALGDSAENPRFVETLARQGYRFIAAVDSPTAIGAATHTSGNGNGAASAQGVAEVTDNAKGNEFFVGVPENVYRRQPSPSDSPTAVIATEPGKSTPVVPRERFFSAARVAFAVLVILLLGTSAGWIAARRLNPKVQIVEQRLTANPAGDPILSAVISPDHKYVAFADRAGMFLRSTSTGETHPVALPAGFHLQPTSWFPDGAHVLATWLDAPKERPSLWSVSVFGGSPSKLYDGGSAGSVSPDGTRIAFLAHDFGSPQIWLMQANGEQPRQLIAEPNHYYSGAVWSPDGKRIAYLDEVYHPGYYSAPSEVMLYIYNVETAQRDRLLSNPRLAAGLTWTADNRLIYTQYEPPPNQTDSNLWVVQLDPHTAKPTCEPVRITNGPDNKGLMSASADGKDLLFLRRSADTDIYVADLPPGGDQLGERHRLHLEAQQGLPYAWTPDNRSVLFVSDRDGPFHLFRQSLDQPTPDLLYGGDDSVNVTRLNYDLSSAMFLVVPSAANSSASTSGLVKIMELPLTGGPPRQILSDRNIHNFQCSRAPAKVCFYSREAGEGLELVRFDATTGKQSVFSEMRDAQWFLYNWTLSPDGSVVAMAKKHHIDANPQIRLVPIGRGTARFLTLPQPAGIQSIDFAADGRSIWTITGTADGTQALVNVDLTGKVKTMLQETQKTIGWAIPSPNGKRIAFWESGNTSNAWLLRGF